MQKLPRATGLLTSLFQSALQSVHGACVVEQHLNKHPLSGEIAIVAIGKAASAMVQGAENVLGDTIRTALVITKDGHCDSLLRWPCIEAGHPVPDQRSLDAGAMLLEFIEKLPKNTKFLSLISGGASALVDVLPESLTLENLQRMNNWLLGSGLDISEMNRVRQSVSKIKGGKLLNYLERSEVTQLIISDVKSDDPALIGSGLFVAAPQPSVLPELPEWLKNFIQPAASVPDVLVNSYIVANNEMACLAVVKRAKEMQLEASYHGQTLYGDVYDVASSLASQLRHASPGIHIWGGETTLCLSESPGRGGRNQSLALALAIALQGRRGITVLVGASDGSDGPTEDAGAVVDGDTLARGELFPGYAKARLAAADAGTFLAEAGALISTGPTGTNVMDLVIALKE